MTMQNLGILLKMGIHKINCNNSTAAGRNFIRWMLHGRDNRRISVHFSGQISPYPQLLQELIQTQHMLAGIKKNKQIHLPFPKNAFHTKTSGIFPQSQISGCSTKLSSCVLFYGSSYWNHWHGFTEMPSVMILFLNFTMLQTVLQGIKPTNSTSETAGGFCCVDIPVRWRGEAGRARDGSQRWISCALSFQQILGDSPVPDCFHPSHGKEKHCSLWGN